MRILILGGYGTFGGRLAALLAGDARLTLLIAGRSLQRARVFCEALAPGAGRIPIAFDRERDPSTQIATHTPDIVIDASGPFQDYGDNPYQVIKACIEHRVDYMDLADGAEFVIGVAAFDDAAKAAGIFVLSGMSSFPVLTAAVVRHLSVHVPRIKSIVGGIAPSPFAGVGLNVIRAIAAYAGQPIELVRNGVPSHAYALTEYRRYTVAPPGTVPLANLHFSLVDVPDLRLLALSWPELETIWIGAGPVPEILHRMLNGLAWLVRFGVLPSLSPLAPIIYHVSNRLRWGEHRGGMFVAVAGHDREGRATEASWHLLAEGSDGPFIPSMACQAMVTRCLLEQRPPCGARAAVMDLELADYETLFEQRTIVTGTRLPVDVRAPLYQRLLGSAWHALPAQIRGLHDLHHELSATGLAEVTRGSSLVSRVVGKLMGFPLAGHDVPVAVQFCRSEAIERWHRTFADQSFSSQQAPGQGRFVHLLEERFGPVRYYFALKIDGDRLDLIPRAWSLFGVTLPLALAPVVAAHETVTNNRFHFNVEISHRLTGPIVHYRGWLIPSPASCEAAGLQRGSGPTPVAPPLNCSPAD